MYRRENTLSCRAYVLYIWVVWLLIVCIIGAGKSPGGPAASPGPPGSKGVAALALATGESDIVLDRLGKEIVTLLKEGTAVCQHFAQCWLLQYVLVCALCVLFVQGYSSRSVRLGK